MTSITSRCRRAWLAGASAIGLTSLLAACSATRILDAFVPTDTYRPLFDQAYGPDPRQKVDIYRPAEGAGPWPVVVFFYGGSWTHGERAHYRFVGEALASRGILTAVVDYRLSPQVRYPVFLQDSAQGLTWVYGKAASLGGDPKRFYVMGHSAGAYNAAMLALDGRWLGEAGMQPRQLAGFIGVAGPYDFLPIDNHNAQVAFNWPDTPADSQPLVHASAAAPRTLLLAARDDNTVNPQRNTEGLARKLRAAGVPVEVEQFDGVSHVTVIASMARPLRRLAPVLDRVVRFVGGTPAS